jgi:hypothetical protein
MNRVDPGCTENLTELGCGVRGEPVMSVDDVRLPPAREFDSPTCHRRRKSGNPTEKCFGIEGDVRSIAYHANDSYTVDNFIDH